MKRNIITIDRDKCNGCSLCINACQEGAIQLVNGKAQLISDKYCDGLGNCLPACPTGAIEIIVKDTESFSEDAVKELLASKKQLQKQDTAIKCGCPGSNAKVIQRKPTEEICKSKEPSQLAESELKQWPVQLSLVHPQAEYFKNANLLVAADCVAYAYANFHSDFIKNHITVIGCPKLDDNEYYSEKLTEILSNNNIKSITVVRMEVPCCGGIIRAIKEAMIASQTIVPYKEVTIGIDGKIIE